MIFAIMKQTKRVFMDNYLNDGSTYLQRMNKTADSKFEVVKPFLGKGVNILDFGSGISPEFISEVVSTGANYYAYDISLTVQTELSRIGVSVLTKSDLLNQTIQFDVIYLSSVFHEIMSYLNRQERTETISMLVGALRHGGSLVIRDWANPDSLSEYFTLQPVSTQAKEEIFTWVHELQRNSIIGNVGINEDGYLVTSVKDAYELIFHTVWGLGSLSRESKEQYSITEALHKWILSPWKDCLELQGSYTSRDDSYLAYLQKYFKLDSVPFDTKCVCIFRKK
jgi:hypothetical protein